MKTMQSLTAIKGRGSGKGEGRMRRVSAAVLVAACATWMRPTAAELRSSAEKFDQSIQWSDLRSAALFLTPVTREEFLAAVAKHDDENNLKITDIQLEDAIIAADGNSATIESKLTWYRMPSVTAKTERMVTHWEIRGNSWVLTRIDGGPLAVGR